ncbi:MAG: helix-turn-helix transcriptional regulator [Roseiflexaceae bacterium]|nr:helix-turn-helix transcriptional regulator [Roseiflexaceae bacterium]
MSNFKLKYQEAYNLLAKRLREAREAAGFTQAEVATVLGKPQSFISKCEIGERRLDFIELKVLAKLYSKDICFFEINID